ncbi:hypothetical protein LSUE1_G005099 [Lachnellula suecica]|uniref:Neprosin PEP catalytic domain-containing protein n=1 Tax=Lachnellula suecica TaxID=602035 RepID=A0A8T9C7S6_9HELO|nr:hypothetical protein LSUE1_G005099 [Lachnellula suecica]
MAAILLRNSLLLFVISFLATGASSNPISSPRAKYVDHSLGKRAINAVKTTYTDGNVIDWVPIESQGIIASPPPPRAPCTNATAPVSELQVPGAEVGPPGTVPIPRVNLDYLTASTSLKEPPQVKPKGPNKRQYGGRHWYVNSGQSVNNFGGSAIYSLFNAYVQSPGDFSLIQTAIVKNSVPIPGNPSSTGPQTLEAGWINYPNQVSQPHLFTYFTTCGYTCSGDNVGGWNRDQAGWVQTDSDYFPGTIFVPDSTDGGSQTEMEISYYLFQGNWWLYVINKYIGYYPASLFSANEANAAATLSNGGDYLAYYGEIYQEQDAMTTTDMGSGEFASLGYGRSAYMHNMEYYDTTTPNANAFGYTSGFGDDDSSRYSHSTVASGGDWGNYIYLGGPGAGGVVNG